MSAPGVVDFLVEVPEADAFQVLQTAAAKKSIFVFKLAEAPTPYQTTIESFFDRRVILDKDVAHLEFNPEQDVSIKFNVGTEIYFVKTKLKKYLNRIYFDKSSKLIQLKRRKEPRYVVPKKWTQVASLGGIPCTVQDISLSGIRFECLDQSVVFKTKEVVSIQFQVYKRAAITTDALIHFFLSRQGQSSLIGMEFQGMKEVQQEKVKAVIEDIINSQAQPKF